MHIANQAKSGPLKTLDRTRMRTALLLALVADVTQMLLFPIFIEGAASGADDALDVVMTALLSWLVGWHWEFLPSFAGKLVPGVDLVPLWTLAVANAYRKAKQNAATNLQ